MNIKNPSNFSDIPYDERVPVLGYVERTGYSDFAWHIDIGGLHYQFDVTETDKLDKMLVTLSEVMVDTPNEDAMHQWTWWDRFLGWVKTKRTGVILEE